MRIIFLIAFVLTLGSAWTQSIYRKGISPWALESNELFTSDGHLISSNNWRCQPLFNGGFSADDKRAISPFSTLALGIGKNGKQFSTEWYLGTQNQQKESFAMPYFEARQAFRRFLAGGYFQYDPVKYAGIRLGYDRLFCGPGLNSLFLSDYAGNMPFVRLHLDVWKINYSFLLAGADNQNSFRTANQFPANKGLVMHVLEFKPFKSTKLSFFEAIVWQTRDSNYRRAIEPSYLNPLIYLRPAEFSLGSPDNALAGLALEQRLYKELYLYGQVLLDEFLLKEIKAQNGWWANKFGFQGGVKWFRAFGLEGLSFLGELNTIRPFTYGHQNNNTNYGHAYRSLAHPWGANFVQLLFLGQFKRGNNRVVARFEQGAKGYSNPQFVAGDDPFVPYVFRSRDYGNTLLQGDLKSIREMHLLYAYILKEKWNVEVFGQLSFRQKGAVNEKQLQIGLRTPFFNTYSKY